MNSEEFDDEQMPLAIELWLPEENLEPLQRRLDEFKEGLEVLRFRQELEEFRG